MIKHAHTENAKLNFSKLEERIKQINDPYLGKYNDIRKMLLELANSSKPVLIMATGGSKVIAYYLQLVIEKLIGNICDVIEPRDYFYKPNKEMFHNLVAISASGNTNGINKALLDFKGKKYLISENKKAANYQVISWGNELYDKEKSFISLATSLGPITLLLDSTTSLNSKLNSNNIKKINLKVKELLAKSFEIIDRLSINFKDTSLIQIMSGYDTKSSASVLESNLVEVGLSAPVIHDKGSFCHGRSNLLYQYPNSKFIYLTHKLKDLDTLIIDCLNNEYANVYLFDTNDLDENVFWKEFYLMLQMYFLSRKIADDKNIDLTQPEYNQTLVKKLYTFKGDM